MKTNTKQNFAASSRVDVQSVLKMLNGLLRVKAGRGWINWLLKVVWILRGSMTAAIARSAVVALRHFYAVYKKQGMPGLVIRTKSLTILLMQSIGGQKVAAQDLGPGVARTPSGLPRIIPRLHREEIRKGNVFFIRLWLSWFSIYRVLNFPGTLKLNTITDPGREPSVIMDLVHKFGDSVSDFLCSRKLDDFHKNFNQLSEIRYFDLSKSTPSLRSKGKKVSTSHDGILTAAMAHSPTRSPIWHSFWALADMLNSPLRTQIWGSIFNFYLNVHPSKLAEKKLYFLEDFTMSWKKARAIPKIEPLVGGLGKLGFKLEPAGKVRVFAMVDCWTQWLLCPIHDWIFKILRSWETDGTFDQLAPIHRLIKLCPKGKFWCYDLSAATDRLPITLQKHLLNLLFGKERLIGSLWADVLVGRDYLLPKLPFGVKKQDIPVSVRYAVGQPMGALSSWAMLALTHHMVVAWAAKRAGFPWGSFNLYAVLGDDVVIADANVAREYLSLMDELGVKVGIHKSLISRKGVLEFAKRYFVQGQDCSPVPFKELVASILDFESNTELVRKYSLSISQLTSFGGWGYKVKGGINRPIPKQPRKLANISLWYYSPWGFKPYTLVRWLKLKNILGLAGPQAPRWWNGIPPKGYRLATPADDVLSRFASTKLVELADRLIERMTFVKDESEEWFEALMSLVAKQSWLSDTGFNPLYVIQNHIWGSSFDFKLMDIRKAIDVAKLFKTILKVARPTRSVPRAPLLRKAKAILNVDINPIICDFVAAFRSYTVLKPLSSLGKVPKVKNVPTLMWSSRLWWDLNGIPIAKVKKQSKSTLVGDRVDILFSKEKKKSSPILGPLTVVKRPIIDSPLPVSVIPPVAPSFELVTGPDSTFNLRSFRPKVVINDKPVDAGLDQTSTVMKKFGFTTDIQYTVVEQKGKVGRTPLILIRDVPSDRPVTSLANASVQTWASAHAWKDPYGPYPFSKCTIPTFKSFLMRLRDANRSLFKDLVRHPLATTGTISQQPGWERSDYGYISSKYTIYPWYLCTSRIDPQNGLPMPPRISRSYNLGQDHRVWLDVDHPSSLWNGFVEREDGQVWQAAPVLPLDGALVLASESDRYIEDFIKFWTNELKFMFLFRGDAEELRLAPTPNNIKLFIKRFGVQSINCFYNPSVTYKLIAEPKATKLVSSTRKGKR